MDDTPLREHAGSDRQGTRQLAIGVVVKGWPRLSETFIAQELVGLEARGLTLRVFSLRHPTDSKVHPVNKALKAPVSYLPEYLWQEPGRVWRAWRKARRLPFYAAASAAWRHDLLRDPTPNRGRRFGQALVLAAELPQDVGHLYAHFLHTPSSVARYTAMLRGITWSASAHAKDIWTTPDWDKSEKLRDAEWVVTCTSAGRDHLNALGPERAVELVHHGIDAARFPMAPPRRARNGSIAADPVVILSVGRAVPKKGFDDLLRALSRLPRKLHWRLVHIGGGPQLRDLKRQAAEADLDARIDWRGSSTGDDVIAAYREADLFVLASRVTGDGDRDGIPNVVAEAMSQGLAVVATTAGAIPELVLPDRTGVLVPSADPAALADALAALIADPDRRAVFGAAGAARILREFPSARGFDRLSALLAASLPCASPSTRH